MAFGLAFLAGSDIGLGRRAAQFRLFALRSRTGPVGDRTGEGVLVLVVEVFVVLQFGFEFQAELHGRIVEAGDGVEGNLQPLRNVLEMQADFEALVIDAQIPELVLQDDGHFVGILLAQAR